MTYYCTNKKCKCAHPYFVFNNVPENERALMISDRGIIIEKCTSCGSEVKELEDRFL